MTKTYTDDFNRADATNLGTPWTASPSGQLQVVGQQAKMTGTSSVLVAVHTQATDTDDQTISLDFTAVGTTFAVLGRVSADGMNYYGFRRASSTQVSLIRVVNGAAHYPFVGPVNATIGVGDRMELRIIGSLIQGWVNGIKVIEGTDTNVPTGRLTGWRSTGTTAGTSFDNYRAADYVPAAGDTTAPSTVAPTISAITANGFRVDWPAATDNVGVTGYRLLLYPEGLGSSEQTDLITSTNYTVGSRPPGSKWTVAVRAYDAAGNYSDGPSATVTTLAAADTTAPSAPTLSLAAGGTANSQPIAWTTATDNVGVTEYRIYVSGQLVDTRPSTDRAYTITALAASSGYSSRVDAADAAGNVTSSNTVNFSTASSGSAASWPDAFAYPDGTIPAPWVAVPSGHWKATSGVAEITVSSTSAAALLQRALLTPNQAVAVDVVEIVGTFMVIGRVDSNLANYYGFRRASSSTVALIKVVGGSSWSSGIIAQAGASVVAGSRMELRMVGNVISGWVDGVKVIEAIDEDVPTGLYGGLRATGNAQGARFDNFSATDVAAGNGDKTPPSSFNSSASAITSSGFTINWEAATDNVGVAGYRVFSNGSQKTVTPASARSYPLAGLSSSSLYAIRVEAFDAAGNTTSAATVNVQTLADSANTTATLQLYSTDGTITTFNNVSFRTWDPIVGKELGYFYGRTVSYWDGTKDTPIQLADARPPITPWRGKRCVFYGDSSGVRQTSSGVDYATADLWPQLVATGFQTDSAGDPSNVDYPTGLGVVTASSSFSNRHGNSFTALDVAVRMLASGASQWVPGSFDLVSVFAGGNDVGVGHDNERYKLGFQHAWSAILGILRSSSRVTTAAEGGTWAAHTSLFSGNARTSSTYGSSRTFTFTGTEATLMLIALTDGGGSPFSYQVDNGPVVTGRTTKGQAAPTLLNGAHCPVPVHIRGLTSGTHTVRVTHTGITGADQLIVDALLPWFSSEKQMPFVLAFPPFYSTTAGWSNYDSPKPDNGDVDDFRRLQQNVLRQFEFAGNIGHVLADLGDVLFPPTNVSYRIADGLHPNKQGHKWIAAVVLEMLRLYAPLIATA